MLDHKLHMQILGAEAIYLDAFERECLGCGHRECICDPCDGCRKARNLKVLDFGTDVCECAEEKAGGSTESQ